MGEDRFGEIHSEATSSDHNGDVRIGLDSWRSSPSIFQSDGRSFPGWLSVMRNWVQRIKQIVVKCSTLLTRKTTKISTAQNHVYKTIKYKNI
jgi:hypothetical protein